MTIRWHGEEEEEKEEDEEKEEEEKEEDEEEEEGCLPIAWGVYQVTICLVYLALLLSLKPQMYCVDHKKGNKCTVWMVEWQCTYGRCNKKGNKCIVQIMKTEAISKKKLKYIIFSVPIWS